MKWIKPIFLLSSALFLGACSVASGEELNKAIPAQNEANNAHLIYKEEIFLDKFDQKHIDLSINHTKIMYEFTKDLTSLVNTLHPNDKISISYEETDTGDQVIHHIFVVEKAKVPVVKKKKTTVESKAISEFKVRLLKGYSLHGDSIVSDQNSHNYARIEPLSSQTAMKQERWRAASILKKIGHLQELFHQDIPNAFFLFRGDNHNETEYISVKKVNGINVRFTIHVVNNDKKQIEQELWNMVNTVQ